ncbi:hypothetical protein CALCODRAFT_39336 [Calocera cornea HHB12733]|uniref:Uncharacterized protein n=1 Tax=Calocera cornea HHB12733 TaxID=1353952 RepID=A0A165DXG6_9BASI|nr:hypothetical protein CALCODRAFT_39336 [Calocera cornea HHB12733]
MSAGPCSTVLPCLSASYPSGSRYRLGLTEERRGPYTTSFRLLCQDGSLRCVWKAAYFSELSTNGKGAWRCSLSSLRHPISPAQGVSSASGIALHPRAVLLGRMDEY